MQRQSLGSPVSKLHSHGGGAKDEFLIVDNDHKRKDFLTSSCSIINYDSEDDHKATKSHRLSSQPPLRPDKFIHLIPILIVLCFLTLYLFSHNPSQSDLAQFNGFKRPSAKRLDSTKSKIGNIAEMSRLMEVQKGDILAIRSLKDLHDTQNHAQKSRLHRKVADF